MKTMRLETEAAAATGGDQVRERRVYRYPRAEAAEDQEGAVGLVAWQSLCLCLRRELESLCAARTVNSLSRR